jgi:DNA-binding FadR family transcriptional regulator
MAANASSGDALFRALVEPAAPKTAEARLRRYIVEHGLGPGDRLPSEAELATALGSSRVVVREALRALEAVGLLESRAGSGWYLLGFDVGIAARTLARSLAFHPNILLDLLAVRRSMEGDLVEEIADTLTERDLDTLDELADRMRWRASRGEPYPAEDAEFHRRLVAASGNLVALALIDLYFGVITVLYQHGFPGPSAAALPVVAQGHAEIVAALRRGDSKAAAHALRTSHNDEARQRLTAWRDAHPAPADANGLHPIQAAIQSALLWPGLR